MKLLHLKNTPILSQLQIEEALLRTSSENYCIINEGSSPAIVMGISGKQNEHVEQDCPLPIIKRFSGGGTVAVDEDTIFITFISNADTHNFKPFPEPIFRWTETLYKPAFPPSFQLIENDYALGMRKFGGNAQYIRKDRWLHHSTLLWDYNPKHMAYVKHPPKMPTYRQNRKHADFLCTLQEHYPSKEAFLSGFTSHLHAVHPITEVSFEKIEHHLKLPHRQTVTVV